MAQAERIDTLIFGSAQAEIYSRGTWRGPGNGWPSLPVRSANDGTWVRKRPSTFAANGGKPASSYDRRLAAQGDGGEGSCLPSRSLLTKPSRL